MDGNGRSRFHPHGSAPFCPRPQDADRALDLAAAKDRLPVPVLWQRLGLPGRPGACCRSPFRRERHPSFSIYDDGRRWKDHATGEGGDAIDFLTHACHVDRAEATRRFLVLAGVPQRVWGQEASRDPHGRDRALEKQQGGSAASAGALHLPVLHRGTEAELCAVARSRCLAVEAAALAESLRTLAFGTVHGQACWILGDDSGRLAEARRLDGRPFSALGPLGPRKAHTLRGSQKSWPCGAAVLRRRPHFRSLLLVEGGPDYLAALHLLLALGRWDILPVAMLGRSTGTRLCPEALRLLAGRRVRLYPHADADGGGVAAAQGWARQLSAQGCVCDLFSFQGLQQADGSPVKDLNDAVRIRPGQMHEMAALLPAPE